MCENKILLNLLDDKLFGVKDNNEFWIAITKTCKGIGLNKNQADRQTKNIQMDFVLKSMCKNFKVLHKEKNRTVVRDILCLKIKALSVWLASINRKSFNEEQYSKYITILNWSLSDDFDKYKTPTKIYSFESELRDEIYNQGNFLDIKITSKETTYNFGRTDLEGIDLRGNTYCIELKKYSSRNDTKEQLLKYKNSGKFNNIIYCAYIIDDELKIWCYKHDIQCYIYNRQLTLNKISA